MRHHFIVPHCDDAWLSMGGTMLSLLENKRRVFIHVIFSQDVYLNPKFIEEVRVKKLKHDHLRKLKSAFSYTPEWKNIKEYVINPKKQRFALFAKSIRILEERLVASSVSANLFLYNFPAAFPLRGYKTFNSPLRNKDAKIQIDKIASILDNRFKKGDKIYTICGIGGHPDHKIVARYIKKKEESYSVSYFPDLPYSTVLDWNLKSQINLYKYKKTYIDISRYMKKKMELLSLYRSQLVKEDLRTVRLFSRILVKFFRKDLPDGNFPAKAKYVEILYQK